MRRSGRLRTNPRRSMTRRTRPCATASSGAPSRATFGPRLAAHGSTCAAHAPLTWVAGLARCSLELKWLGVPHLFVNDISPEMIEIAQTKHPDVSYRVGPIEESPYSPSSFDVVTGFSVLHHLPDLRRFFHWLSTVLRVGGIFAFSEPNAASVMSDPVTATWIRRSTLPFYRLVTWRNREWPSGVPDMSDEHFYSDAHRSLTPEDVRGAACDRLALDIMTHGVLTPPFCSVVRDCRLDRAVVMTLNAVDRLLPLRGYLLFITGRRIR